MRGIIYFFLFLFTLSVAQAQQILIIHTNDLHSYFSGCHNGLGGYSRLMTKIKELRSMAEEEGIEVLQLDAGDWGDGTSYYYSDQGADSIRALELFGVDVAAIGNHDHILGGEVLGQQLRRANVKTKFVAANINTTSAMNLDGLVLPYVDLDRGGVRMRIIGLTTSSVFFQYSMRPGSISSPIIVGEREARKARRAKREVVIALTHIGVNSDKFLAQNSSSIDVIIGGHSHTRLKNVLWEPNLQGRNIPIVQAWSHGLSVGTLLLDVSNRGQIRRVKYKLHDISSSIAEDAEMASFVREAADKKNRELEMGWDEIIGNTKTPIAGNQSGDTSLKLSCWGNHMARATREAVDADIGLHVPSFAGVYKSAGPITFGDIVDNFPHIRKYGDPGWEIATVSISGWQIKPLMYLISRIGYGVDFSGLGYKTIEDFNDKAIYKMAFPAEIAVGIKGSIPQFRGLLRDLEFTNVYLWPTIIDYVRENSPIKCLRS